MDIEKRNLMLSEIEDILESLKESLLVLEAGLEMIDSKGTVILNNNDTFLSIPNNIISLKPYLSMKIGKINAFLTIMYQRLYALFMINDFEAKDRLSKFDLKDVSLCLKDVLKSISVIINTEGYKNRTIELDIPNFVNYDYRDKDDYKEELSSKDNDINLPKKIDNNNDFVLRFKVLTQMLKDMKSVSKEDLKLYYQIKDEINKLNNNPLNIAKIKFHFISLERKYNLNKSNRYKYLIEKEKKRNKM